MSKYTITIKNLIDNDFDFKMDSYPIFDESYRETLNQNILDYYYEDEIGLETPALFRKFLNNRLNIIMPKYNILYEAQREYALNLYNNTNIREELTRTADSTTNSTSSSNSTSNGTSQGTTNGKNLYQDTPQGKITQAALEEQTWATNVTFDNSTNSGSSSNTSLVNDSTQGTGNANEHYVKTLVGGDKIVYADAYKKVVDNIVSIDQMIIEELSDLFMGIF